MNTNEFIESLKRLYSTNQINMSTLQTIRETCKLTEEEMCYILGKDE